MRYIILTVVAIPLLFLIITAFFSVGVAFAWNMFSPAFGLPQLTISEAFGIVLLLVMLRLLIIGISLPTFSSE